MEFETLANSWLFVVSAYIAAFLPWTAIASTDFISAKWISVRRTRAAGYRNLIWTLFPLVYVVFYGVVQGKAKEYTEMCAAAVAAVFAALIGIRTIWGLWQLHLFHSWACQSIDALRAVGVEYSLLRLQRRKKRGGRTGARMKTEDVADEILVSEKIIDNQISHGDVQCFIQFGNISLLQSDESKPLPTHDSRVLQTAQDVLLALLEPLYMIIPWLLIPSAVVVEFALVFVGRRKPKKLRMVPKEPVEVWVHWAATFAAQGLGKWMEEFEVAVDPEAAPEVARKRAVDRFHARGKYFGAQLLASAAFQMWTDDDDMTGVSPMLWDDWNEDSHMSDGLVVKQELLQEAIRSGKCLPFGTSHMITLEVMYTATGNGYYSYDKYQDVLGEFVSELPVRSTFVKEMRKFDTNMLEWLTILLHLGHCALENERTKDTLRHNSNGGLGMSSGSAIPLPGSERTESELDGGDADANEEPGSVRGVEATKNLRSQLGVSDNKVINSSNKFQQGSEVCEGGGPLGSPLRHVPILRDVCPKVSENNRLVPKAGQLIDVWLSLVCGDQILFLVEELNGDWKHICLGRDGTLDTACEPFRTWDLRESHKQLERRRLERRIAHEKGRRYMYLDQYPTFMGYRMESVRTVFGRWVELGTKNSVDDLLRAARTGVHNDIVIEVHLSEAICSILERPNALQVFERKGVQCRLVWELQNKLEMMVLSEENWVGTKAVEEMGMATVMLMLLSFPGLRVEVRPSQEPLVIERNGDDCCIDMGFFHHVEQKLWGERWKRYTENADEREEPFSLLRAKALIRVMCAPQELSLEVDFDYSGTCTLRLKESVLQELKWKWWRDSFLGRLEGFQDWQRDMGVTPVSLDLRIVETVGMNFKEICMGSDKKVALWTEWSPFRSQFCLLELVNQNLLKQPIVVGHKNVQDAVTGFIAISHLPVCIVRPVSYHNADELVLKDSCMLVRDAWSSLESELCSQEGQVRNAENLDIDDQSNTRSIVVVDDSRKRTTHHIRAIHFEDYGCLKEYMTRLCENNEKETLVSDAIQVLGRFMGTMLSHASAELKEGRETEIGEQVIPACERLIGVYTGSGIQIENLCEILDTCFTLDPIQNYKSVMKLMQRMLCLCTDKDAELFLLRILALDMECIERSKAISKAVAGCKCEEGSLSPFSCGFHRGFSEENYRTCLGILEMIVAWRKSKVIAKTKDSSSSNGICWYCSRRRPKRELVISEGSNKRRTAVFFEAFRSLGLLLERGGEGVPTDVQRAVQLYEIAIREGNNVLAMTNLAGILLEGAQGVHSDTNRAIELFERAIREGKNTYAMNSLALALENGTGGILVDKKRAFTLYERAIKEGDNVAATTNLGNLLVRGADGISPDAPRAKKLFERAILEGGGPRPMTSLASLHKKGADGVTADAGRAVMLLERAIREYSDTCAMNNLAVMLETGAEGVPADAVRAAGLYERAIQGGNAAAMSNLGSLLENRAKGVLVDTRRAVNLYERSIREGENLYGMDALGRLLENGAEGVPSDVQRSVRLYKRAIRKGKYTPAMSHLGALLEKGAEGIEPDPGRAAGLFERAIREGNNVSATNNLGVLLVNGADGVPCNVKRAAELFERLIREKNLVDAKNNLGWILKNRDDGVTRDPRRAKQLFEEAIREGNDTAAMYNLASLLQHGAEGVRRNIKRAVELYETVVDREDEVDAMYDLADILHDGAEGVPRDTARAFELYERAVEKGAHVFSMNNMGLLLQNGADGVAQDAPRAKELYERAILEGKLPESKYNLGTLLEHGAEGVARDVDRAVELYESAIREDNFVPAKVRLGWILEWGAHGVPQNEQRAVELYEGAAEQGNVDAMYGLSRLLLRSAADVAGVHRGLEMMKKAMDVKVKVDSVLLLAAAVIICAPSDEMAVQTAKSMMRRAVSAGSAAEDFVNMKHIWEGLKHGRYGLVEDTALAEEIERYAEQCGIVLSEVESESEISSHSSDVTTSGSSSDLNGAPEGGQT